MSTLRDKATPKTPEVADCRTE